MATNNGKSNLTASVIQKDLIGGNGKDYLNGDDQDNNLNGGNGADTIWGGKGSDILTGGNGNDIFVYKAGDLTPVTFDHSLGGWAPGSTNGGLDGKPGEVRANGHYAVDTTYGDSNGAPGGASMHLWTTDGGSTGKVDVVNYDASLFGTNATLGNLNNLGFDWIKGLTSADNHFAPALRLSFTDSGADHTFGTADDVSGYLIWEHIYDFQNTPGNTADQHLTAAEGTWFHENLMDSEMYMRIPGHGGDSEIPVYTNTLSNWQAGATVTGNWAGATPITLDSTTHINGIEIGLGSGWGGTFDGAVDNVHIGFGSDTHVFDFGALSRPVDQITDFETGKDTIDLHGLLSGVTSTSNVNDYVQASLDAQGNTHLLVDANGAAGGSSFVEFAVLQHATINLAHDIII